MKSRLLIGLFSCFVLFGILGFGDSVSAIKLQDSGCSISATEKLFEAVSKGDVEGVKTALNEATDINALSDDHIPLLHFAAKNVYNGTDMVRNLLAYEELDVNSMDSFGYTALHVAIADGNINVVRVLLMDPRTDVNAEAWGHKTPLELALEEGKVDIAKVILGCSSLRVLDKNGCGTCRVLKIANEKGYTDIAEIIEKEYIVELLYGV